MQDEAETDIGVYECAIKIPYSSYAHVVLWTQKPVAGATPLNYTSVAGYRVYRGQGRQASWKLPRIASTKRYASFIGDLSHFVCYGLGFIRCCSGFQSSSLSKHEQLSAGRSGVIVPLNL